MRFGTLIVAVVIVLIGMIGRGDIDIGVRFSGAKIMAGMGVVVIVGAVIAGMIWGQDDDESETAGGAKATDPSQPPPEAS